MHAIFIDLGQFYLPKNRISKNLRKKVATKLGEKRKITRFFDEEFLPKFACVKKLQI